MSKYKLKPIEIEAMQWSGDNANEFEAFVGKKKLDAYPAPEGFFYTFKSKSGEFIIAIGDWIIKDDEGYCEYMPGAMFDKYYSPVEEPEGGVSCR